MSADKNAQITGNMWRAMTCYRRKHHMLSPIPAAPKAERPTPTERSVTAPADADGNGTGGHLGTAAGAQRPAPAPAR